MKYSILLLVLGCMSGFGSHAHATVELKNVVYEQDGTKLEGVLALNPTLSSLRPGLLIVHDWMGISDDTKMRARQMAEQGYVVFAADIYGQKVRPKDAKEAGALAGKYKADRKLLRARVQAALKVLTQQLNVDKSKIVTMGFCFGGTTVLELARSGADVKGTVSFHGGLDNPNPEGAQLVKGKILALHGADDPFVKPEEVAQFQKEMRDAKVDWQMISYGNAVHAFTVKAAGNDPSKGAAYNPEAERRSMAAMKTFFAEVLGRP